MKTRSRTVTEVCQLVSDAKLRSFTRNDWYAWAGCQSEEPLIGEVVSGEITTIVIVDGDTVLLIDTPSDGNFIEGSDDGKSYTFTPVK